jgi:hypothetical protein
MASSAVKRNGLGLAGAVALSTAFSPSMSSAPAQASVTSTPSSNVGQNIDLLPRFGQSYIKSLFDREPVQNPYFNPKRIIEQPVPGSHMAAAATPVGHGQGIRPTGCRM